ncbi:hypothetical protein [Lactobacillus ultunensis]|uniref:hypothetical protein n=1 Tax=Lactobacillus ultunensis TaxID=227945 RepID=UPI001F491312|nr:hypothetical protein [Lactobacillus ultunensis]
MTNPDSLRLFTNTMPIWSQENLSFFIERLLAKIDKNNRMSELMQERYLRILENYLTVCYQRRVQEELTAIPIIKKVFSTIIKLSSSIHFILYKIVAIYLQDLLLGHKDEALEIKNNMKNYGFQNLVKNWPK